MSQTAFLLAEDEWQPALSILSASACNLNDAGRKEYWATLALRHTPGLGARRQARLLRKFGSALAACEAVNDWRAVGIPSECSINYKREAWRTSAKREWDCAHGTNAHIILWNSASYPAQLRCIKDSPTLLYCLGDISLLSGPCIALVGTRQPTDYSRKVTSSFAESLSRCGITVVSGMAAGIDREAHMAALTGSGSSIGILGTGITIKYPASNADIYTRMLERGLLVSEFPPDTAPAAANFPIRNRIISGLSLGIVVMEAATRSGSLITARLALEQDREVFAVPGPALNAHSLGCQNLIRQGARPVFCVDDIFRDLKDSLKTYTLDKNKPVVSNFLYPELPNPLQPGETSKKEDREIGGDTSIINSLLSDSDKVIVCLRNHDILDQDALLALTGLTPPELNAALLGLEMLGRIDRLPGARIRLLA